MNFDSIMQSVQATVKESGVAFFQGNEAEFESFLRKEIPNALPRKRMSIVVDGVNETVEPDIITGDGIAFELSYRATHTSTGGSAVRETWKVWRDVWKIEQLIKATEETSVKSGYAIILSDIDKNWCENQYFKQKNVQVPKNFWLYDFRLFQVNPGRVVSDETLAVNWNGEGVRKQKRLGPRVKVTEENKNDEGIGKLPIRGSYTVDWQNWHGFCQAEGAQPFRYLALKVESKRRN